MTVEGTAVRNKTRILKQKFAGNKILNELHIATYPWTGEHILVELQ